MTTRTNVGTVTFASVEEPFQPSCDISLILPAYNESATILSTLEQISGYFHDRGKSYQIIVAADGNDGTREKARLFSPSHGEIKVIGEPVRRGKGRAIREGVRLATGSIVGFADADNKVPITEYEKIEPWLSKGYEVVIGSRALSASVIERPQKWYRRVGSQGFYRFMRAAVGDAEVGDTQCGFKFFPRHIAKDLFSRQRIDGYMFDVEILVMARRAGYRIAEVPIRWRDDGDSRLRLLSGNVRNVIDILRIGYSADRRLEPLQQEQPVKSISRAEL